MLNPRESIEYHKRKFKYVFSDVADDAEFKFDFDPPNEFAFSDRYSQCLIQITKAVLNNRGDTVNKGLDSQFTTPNGVGQILCENGVEVRTSIRSNNKLYQKMNIAPPQQISSGIFAVLQSKFGAAGDGGDFYGQAVNCATFAARGLGTNTAGAQGGNQNLHNVNTWEYVDTRPIEDGGVLCPNPFGQPVEVKLFGSNNAQVKLTSESNFNVAASNGTSLYLEMDVLMLPNPTPDDK